MSGQTILKSKTVTVREPWHAVKLRQATQVDEAQPACAPCPREDGPTGALIRVVNPGAAMVSTRTYVKMA